MFLLVTICFYLCQPLSTCLHQFLPVSICFTCFTCFYLFYIFLPVSTCLHLFLAVSTGLCLPQLTTLACSDTDTGDSLTYTVRTPHNTQFGFNTPDDELKLLTGRNYVCTVFAPEKSRNLLLKLYPTIGRERVSQLCCYSLMLVWMLKEANWLLMVFRGTSV